MVNRMLYLVRHGQYDTGRREDGELTPLGRQQAAALAAALADLPFTRMVYSPVRRARQTAEILAQALPDITCEEDDSLRECIPTIPQQHAALFAERYPEVTADRVINCQQRLDRAFDTYMRPYEQTDDEQQTDTLELLVCHGNVIRYLVSRVLGAPADAWTTMLIHHCGLTRVTVERSGLLYLISHNDIGHLSDDLRTEN